MALARCVEGYEQEGDRALVKCKESLSLLQKNLGAVLVFCKNDKVLTPKRVFNFQTSVFSG
ncbi:MAG TPA: hypothetical protein DCF91_13250 [Porphyromonadaceae bacterium]|nr:hypothetical protein [Porphyromonadaceae bacterium]